MMSKPRRINASVSLIGVSPNSADSADMIMSHFSRSKSRNRRNGAKPEETMPSCRHCEPRAI